MKVTLNIIVYYVDYLISEIFFFIYLSITILHTVQIKICPIFVNSAS